MARFLLIYGKEKSMTDEAIFQDTSTTMQFKKSVIRIQTKQHNAFEIAWKQLV
jgi:hypothetical protein